MTSLREVADAVGVSVKTVSRVVNRDPNVADATRARVQQMIDELGYRPNLLARGLARGKTNTVGVVIHLPADSVFAYPLFGDTLRGIADTLGDRLGLLLHLGRGDVPYLELSRQHRVDGLILMNIPMGDPNLRGLLDSAMPCVFTCRVAPDEPRANWVDPDFASGAAAAVRHLVRLGHRRVGLLAGPEHLFSAHERVRGAREELERHGLALDPGLVCFGDLFFESARPLARALVTRPDPATAILCADDAMACEAIYELQELGFAVPHDISVIGSDDSSVARVFRPSLTSVRQDAYAKGSRAAARLIELISGAGPPEPQQILLAMTLIPRESTAAPGGGREA